ncbi:hypothetical protein NUW54_g4572 [Trametes sanguinea]|uniref:Uncharacterized protein n=1 Tax=Trametes sanguinea TaxID=158606 RepID=A0ACC1PZ44_9APHY|nr:hypothetical protein NUW54_g4572 [Trametes sanguinea]
MDCVAIHSRSPQSYIASSLIFSAYAFARSRGLLRIVISRVFIAGGQDDTNVGRGITLRIGTTCCGGGENERRGSGVGLGLVECLLDRDERDGVRGRDEKRFRLVSVARKELGARVPKPCCFSSSEPPLVFFDTNEAEREMVTVTFGSPAALPFAALTAQLKKIDTEAEIRKELAGLGISS